MSSHMAVPTPGFGLLPLRHRAAGALGCAAALILLRFPIRTSVRIVARFKGLTPHEASTDEASAAVAAARAASRFFPGRFACLESSLASTLTALLLLRRVDWCIGARTMPYAAHAWIEVSRRPIGEPDSSDHPYLVLLRT